MKRLLAGMIACFWLAVISSSTSFASVISYNFTSLFPDGTNYAFAYMAVGFVTTDVTIPASALDYCTISNPQFTCVSVGILPSGPDDPFAHHPEIRIDRLVGSDLGSAFFYFPFGAFTVAGTYQTVVNNPGRLALTQVPEPSTTVLIGAGLLFAAFVYPHRRRRFTRGLQTPIPLYVVVGSR